MFGRTLLGIAVAVGVAAPAQAAFPGANGRIVFSSQGDLWSVQPDGTGLDNLTETAVAEAQAAFSPDGAKIAFRRQPAGETAFQVYVMNADGSDQRRVTTDTAFHATQPGWSADGTRLVYRRATPGQNLSGDVWTADANGTNARALVTTPGADERYPAFSPDGTRLAFTSSREGAQFDLFVAAADGTGQTRLTTDPGYDSAPSWSPDAGRLAFERGARLDDEPTKDVWIMNANGTGQSVLAATPGVVDEGPAFSPDGTQIAFSSGRDGTTEIYRMAADGRNPARVVTRAATGEESPDWQAVPRGPAPSGFPAPPPDTTAQPPAGTTALPPPGTPTGAAGGGPSSATAALTDRDRDGLTAPRERVAGTSDLDLDSDDDGLSDGREIAATRTSPTRRDTDRDGLRDGVEAGVRSRIADPPGPVLGTARARFRPDADPRTRTDPRRPDTDRDGRRDGREDRNANGRRDRGESDPRRP